MTTAIELLTVGTTLETCVLSRCRKKPTVRIECDDGSCYHGVCKDHRAEVERLGYTTRDVDPIRGTP